MIQKQRLPVKDILLYGMLPGFIKKSIYRMKGYKIGKHVSLSLGSVLCAKNVSIGEYTKIGFFTIIRGESIKIGSHVSIGSTSFIDTPFVEIGDESKINEQVFVGGLQFHDSKFVMGRNCQIMQLSYINPAISITMGDDSCIGGHCLLFGHNSWLNQFEGYDVVFKPIEIGNSVALAWRVFVLPGSTIGDGSIIAPDSLVNRDIPPKSLAAGFPAKIISKPPLFPKELNDDEKMDMLKNIMTEMIRYFSGSGLECRDCGIFYEILETKTVFLFKQQKLWRLKILFEAFAGEMVSPKDKPLDVLVSLKAIPVDARRKLNATNTMWLDIERKERPNFWNDLGDEVALFLRRYGVRFSRVQE